MDLQRLNWICHRKKECDKKGDCDGECKDLDICEKIEFIQTGLEDLKRNFSKKFPDKLENLQIIEVIKSEAR